MADLTRPCTYISNLNGQYAWVPTMTLLKAFGDWYFEKTDTRRRLDTHNLLRCNVQFSKHERSRLKANWSFQAWWSFQIKKKAVRVNKRIFRLNKLCLGKLWYTYSYMIHIRKLLTVVKHLHKLFQEKATLLRPRRKNTNFCCWISGKFHGVLKNFSLI